MKEGKFKTVNYVVVIGLHLKLVEQQVNIADGVDMSVEVNVAVFEAVFGTVIIRLDPYMFLLQGNRTFDLGYPIGIEIESGKARIASV